MTHQNFTPTRLGGLLACLASIISAPANAGEPATSNPDPRRLPVTAIEAHGDELVVIAARQKTTFDGTYKSRTGGSIEFKGGEAEELIDKDGGKTSIDNIKIEDGKVVFGGDGNDILLADGKYEHQGDPEPQPQPEPEPQPRPNPNAFEVEDGKIVAVWL